MGDPAPFTVVGFECPGDGRRRQQQQQQQQQQEQQQGQRAQQRPQNRSPPSALSAALRQPAQLAQRVQYAPCFDDYMSDEDEDAWQSEEEHFCAEQHSHGSPYPASAPIPIPYDRRCVVVGVGRAGTAWWVRGIKEPGTRKI
jgi:hypothetical protein